MLMMWIPIIAGVGLLLFAVSAQSHWQRATAGSLLFLVWIVTAIIPNVRLSYQQEFTELFLRIISERSSRGEEAVPAEYIDRTVRALDQGENPFDAMCQLYTDLKKVAQQFSADEPTAAPQLERETNDNPNHESEVRSQ